MTRPILPGSVVGVLGSGQLGRMFAIAARRMGYRVHTFSPDTDTPTGQVSDKEWQANYDDIDKIKQFAKEVQVVTFEFENIPVSATKEAEAIVAVRPGPHVLHTTQHRLREKTFLSSHGFPVAKFEHVKNVEALESAIKKIGLPCVLKSAGFGYDGKGQRKINSIDEGRSAFSAIGGSECVLESFVSFEKEISVVGVRSEKGAFVHYGTVENTHRNHILDLTVSPANISSTLQKRAVEMAKNIFESLQVVGVMTIEMFVTKDEDLLVNELAPRPHNSGHFTIDACETSQFEQQLRAVCGLPLGSSYQPRPAAMVNLLGDAWNNGEPQWEKALALPGVHLHLYGKSQARPGRKMGHITALSDTPKQAAALALKARESLLASH